MREILDNTCAPRASSSLGVFEQINPLVFLNSLNSFLCFHYTSLRQHLPIFLSASPTLSRKTRKALSPRISTTSTANLLISNLFQDNRYLKSRSKYRFPRFK